MDNKYQKDISNLEFNKGNLPDDYKLLVQKLTRIKNIIKILEKNFLEKEI
tara:strand:- start:427 stop:576 length:150 start_codon:yes stop_codon:yes gene_type:complete